MQKKQIKAVDFFCSGGGMTNGMKQAGIDVIAGIDFDADCQKTYETNNICFIGFLTIGVKINSCNYIDTCLLHSVGHTTPGTKEIDRLYLLFLHRISCSILWIQSNKF